MKLPFSEFRRMRLFSNNKGLWNVFFSFGAIQFAQMAAPLIILPWFARILEPRSFGLLMYMCLLPPLVALVMDWGLTTGGARSCALARDGEDAEKREALESVFSAKLLLGLACAAFCAAISPFVPHAAEHPVAWLLACCAGLARGSSPLWFYQGLGEGMRKMAAWDVAAAGLVLALSLIFIRDPDDWPLYLFFLAICKGGAYAWLTYGILKRWPAKFRPVAGLRAIRDTGALFAAPLSSTICNNGTQFIMGYWLSAAESGVLNACSKMFRALAGLANPAIQTLYPESCRAAALEGRSGLRRFAAPCVAIFLGMGALSCAAYMLAPWLIKIALGAGYGSAVPTLRAMLVAAPLLACNQAIASQRLLPLRLEKMQAFAAGFAAAASIPLSIWLASDHGLAGCAWLPLIIELVILPVLCLGCMKPGLFKKY